LDSGSAAWSETLLTNGTGGEVQLGLPAAANGGGLFRVKLELPH
jgi:hypothetical protein